jgi:hypothetical protein
VNSGHGARRAIGHYQGHAVRCPNGQRNKSTAADGDISLRPVVIGRRRPRPDRAFAHRGTMNLSKVNQITALYTYSRREIRPPLTSLVTRSGQVQVPRAEQMLRNPG